MIEETSREDDRKNVGGGMEERLRRSGSFGSSGSSESDYGIGAGTSCCFANAFVPRSPPSMMIVMIRNYDLDLEFASLAGWKPREVNQ
jgi:hypothetical protein